MLDTDPAGVELPGVELPGVELPGGRTTEPGATGPEPPCVGSLAGRPRSRPVRAGHGIGDVLALGVVDVALGDVLALDVVLALGDVPALDVVLALGVVDVALGLGVAVGEEPAVGVTVAAGEQVPGAYGSGG